MSVIDRLNRLVRANLNDFVSRTSSRSALNEVRGSLREARTQLVEVRATEKRLAAEYEGLLDDSASWEERAMLALRSGDEALARQALYRKQEISARSRSIKGQLDEHRTYMQDLSRSLDAIEFKLEAIRDQGRAEGSRPPVPPVPPVSPELPGSRQPERGPAVSSRSIRLEAEVELGGLENKDTFAAFDEMTHRITRAEAELEALSELRPVSELGGDPSDEIDARFKELEIKRDLERLTNRSDALGDLRRRMDEE